MKRIMALLGAVGIVVSLGGCSSSDGLSKAEYVSQGNEICQRFEQQALDATMGLQPTTRGDLAELSNILLSSARDMRQELGALTPSEEEQPTVDAMLAKFDEAMVALTDFVATISEGDQSEGLDFEGAPPPDIQAASDRLDVVGGESDAVLDEYGLTSCGSEFGP